MIKSFNMKSLKCLLYVAAVALALVGCRKSVEVSFSTTSQEVGAQGGSFEVVLTSNGEWTISETSDWIVVDPRSGNGGTTLAVTVEPNLGAEARTGIVKATTKDNTAVLTVKQSAGKAITITPDHYQCGTEGGEFTVWVTANFDWTVMDAPDWVVFSETEGSGDNQLTVTVMPPQGELAASREASVTIGNADVFATLLVVQSPSPQVIITVTPEILEMPCTGGTNTFAVSCEGAWTAEPGVDWIAIDKTQGEGNDVVTVTVGENPEYVIRLGAVELTSSTGNTTHVIVSQEASPDPHFLEVSPLSFNFGKEGGTAEITIGCDTDWQVVLESVWASLSASSGYGDATITLTVEPNTISEPRELEIMVVSGLLNQMLTVTQEPGDEPILASFDPDTVFVVSDGGTAQLNLSCNSTWSLQVSDNWIILIGNNAGEGDATVNLIIDSNTSEETRTGYVNVVHNGQVLATAVIVQEGKPNILYTDITEIEAHPEGGDYTIHVTSNQDWTVMTDVEWITFTPSSGFGPGDITVTIAPSPSPRPRTGHINIKGSTGLEVVVTVNQY